jgi:hypothetical protein
VDAAHKRLDGVPLVGERSAVGRSVATEAEAEAGVATAKGCLEGVDTGAVREVCPLWQRFRGQQVERYMDVQASPGPRGEAQDVLRSAWVAGSGTDAAVGEEGRSRHSADCEASVGDRPVGSREGQSDRMGARAGDSAGQGRLRAHVVDPSTDSFDL